MALTTPDQSTWTPLDTGGQLAQAPEGTTPDGVFTFTSAESSTGFVRRVIDGAYRASWGGVFAGGVAASNATRLNAILSNEAVKEVVFDTPEGGDISLSGTINIPFGKVLSFSNGSSFTGVYTLVNPTIKADYNQILFNGTPTITNPRSYSGKFSATWWGVVANGSDISDRLDIAATSIATSRQKTLIFIGASSNYLLSNAVTLNNSIIYQFENGAVLNCTAALNGGIIDVPLTQSVFTSSSIVNPVSSVGDGRMSVKWFSAVGNNSNDDYTAIQNTIDTIIRNNDGFKIVWFPSGTYRYTQPLIAYRWSGVVYQFFTVDFEGEGTIFPSSSANAATLAPTFKNAPALSYQLCKGGKIKGIQFKGGFVPPFTEPNYAFYSCTFENFVDPTCRDSQFSPFCAVAIDPFTNSTTLPPDGGYPTLTSFYRGLGSTGGSTGIQIENIIIDGFVVGVGCSVNGVTLNDELVQIQSIQFRNCKLGISGGQDQEKDNTVDHFACWDATHTIFATGLYGKNVPGNWYISNGNIAGAVNRLIYNKEGGYYPCYFEKIFAERLGTIGTLTSDLSPTFKDSVIDFAFLNETKNTQYVIDNQEGTNIIFKDSTLRYIDAIYPISVRGNLTFDNCTFNEVPFTDGIAGGQTGTVKFQNCKIKSTNGVLGQQGFISFLQNQVNLQGSSPYGQFSLINPLSSGNVGLSSGNGFVGYNFLSYQHSFDLNLGSHAVAITGTDRQFSITLAGGATNRVDLGRVVWSTIGGARTPLGIVTNINVGTGVVTMSYANSALNNGTYTLTVTHPIRIGPAFLGDFTASSPTVSNVKLIQGAAGAVQGTWVKLPVGVSNFSEWFKIIEYNSGAGTLTLSGNSQFTRSGVFIYNGGTQFFTANNTSFSISNTECLQKGGRISLLRYNGIDAIIQNYIVTQSGYLDPSAASDTRRGYFMPDGVFLGNGNPETAISFPAGAMVRDVSTGNLYLKTATTAAINGGNTGWVLQGASSSNTQILSASITGNTSVIIPSGSSTVSVVTNSASAQSGLNIGTTVSGNEIDSVTYGAGEGSSTLYSTRGDGAKVITFSNVTGTVTYKINLFV